MFPTSSSSFLHYLLTCFWSLVLQLLVRQLFRCLWHLIWKKYWVRIKKLYKCEHNQTTEPVIDQITMTVYFFLLLRRILPPGGSMWWRAGESQFLLLKTKALSRWSGKLQRLWQLQPAKPREKPHQAGDSFSKPRRRSWSSSVYFCLPFVLWHVSSDSLYGE